MVMPKNFDNPDEAFALARAYALRMEEELRGTKTPVPMKPEQDTEKQNDTTK